MIRRLAPLIFILVPVAAGIAASLALGPDVFRADTILARRDALRAAAEAEPVLFLVLFTAVYFAIISSALPVGPPMSLMAGFLFGRWVGTAAILVAATAGAAVVFTVARLTAGTAFGLRLRARAGPLGDTVVADLRANAFGYLLVMRLVPLFPFFLVNVLAGLAALPLRTFVLATILGRLPAAFLYVSLGEEVGRVSSFAELASGRIVATLCGLALLALVPVVVAHRRGRTVDPPSGEGRS